MDFPYLSLKATIIVIIILLNESVIVRMETENSSFYTYDIAIGDTTMSSLNLGQMKVTTDFSKHFFNTKMTLEQSIILDKLMLTFQTHLNMALGVSAILSNIVNLMVLSDNKHVASPYTYMRILAVCDMLSGLFLILLGVSAYTPLQYTSYVSRVFRHHLTIPVYTILEILATASGLLAMALAIDRMVAVRFPLRKASLCTITRAHCVCGIIIIVSILTNILSYFRLTMVWYWHKESQVYLSTLAYTAVGANYNINNLARSLTIIFRMLVPFISMIATNIVTLKAISDSQKFKKSAAASKKADDIKSFANVHCLTITIGVVIAFFITQAPRAVFYLLSIIYGNKHRGKFAFEVFYILTEFTSWSNTNVNFFIYSGLSKTFRQQILSMCHSKKNVGSDIYMVATTNTSADTK